jgi:hypothetical protein
VVLHGWVERGPAGQHGVQRPLDVGGTGVLGEEPAGAGPQRIQHRPVVRVRGQRDHRGRVPLVAEPADRLDPVAARHPQVHQDHVRAQPPGHG